MFTGNKMPCNSSHLHVVVEFGTSKNSDFNIFGWGCTPQQHCEGHIYGDFPALRGRPQAPLCTSF